MLQELNYNTLDKAEYNVRNMAMKAVFKSSCLQAKSYNVISLRIYYCFQRGWLFSNNTTFERFS